MNYQKRDDGAHRAWNLKESASSDHQIPIFVSPVPGERTVRDHDSTRQSWTKRESSGGSGRTLNGKLSKIRESWESTKRGFVINQPLNASTLWISIPLLAD